jgi:hypothetical protein
MLPRDAFFAAKETVPSGEAVGRICAEQITLYAPGIPVIIPASALPPNSWNTCAPAWPPECSFLTRPTLALIPSASSAIPQLGCEGAKPKSRTGRGYLPQSASTCHLAAKGPRELGFVHG